MTVPYHNFNVDNNARLESRFETEQDERPTNRAVQRLASSAGISTLHARAVLSANGLNGGYDA